MTKKIALLATGDEITNGVILNTNAQRMAQALFDRSMQVGSHAVTADDDETIIQTINFLLQTHDGIILTGGLGPTSDDRTRFALAKAIQQPMEFDQASWDHIVARLTSYGLSVPEQNRQQAMLPKTSVVIPNHNGTAAGCWVNHQEKFIFMLPGPPKECMPMFEQHVLPVLQANDFQDEQHFKQWLLFGISEGHLGASIDQIEKPEDCLIGYRIHYPYLDLKLFAKHQQSFELMQQKILPLIQDCMMQDADMTASEKLKQKIATTLPRDDSNMAKLVINDHATGGSLAQKLLSPTTFQSIEFSQNNPTIVISGLEEYWQQQETPTTSLRISYQGEDHDYELPYHGRERILLYAVEFICKEIIDKL